MLFYSRGKKKDKSSHNAGKWPIKMQQSLCSKLLRYIVLATKWLFKVIKETIKWLYAVLNMFKDLLQILLLILSNLSENINFCSSLKSSESLQFSNDFKGEWKLINSLKFT